MNEPLQLGRYSLLAKLASGGMATVYLGRLNGEAGFGRMVAVKRLHPHLAGDPQFTTMFLDEARLAARIQHPNVVPTLDVVTLGSELFIVMEYVKGEPLSALLSTIARLDGTIPIPIATAIAIGALNGLHAAHEATDEQGEKLSIVHRDVSPQNVLVGADGVARLLDFGIAKAAMRMQSTREGQLKGKLGYMAPEQVKGAVSRRTDIFSAGVVLWEMLACRRMYVGDTEGQLLRKVAEADVKPPSRHAADVPAELDRIVMKALAKDPAQRYATADAMAEELDGVLRPASTMSVAQWVQNVGRDSLAARNQLVAQLESDSSGANAAILAELVAEVPPSHAGADPADVPDAATLANAALTPQPDLHSLSRVGSLTREAPREPAARGWLALGAAIGIPVVLVAVLVAVFVSSGPGAASGVVAAGPLPPPTLPGADDPAESGSTAAPAPASSIVAQPLAKTTPVASAAAAAPPPVNAPSRGVRPPAAPPKSGHATPAASSRPLDVFSGPRT